MKYFFALVLVLVLTGCFSSEPKQVLPPELQGVDNPLLTTPPETKDPLAEFPPIEKTEPPTGEATVVPDTTETQTPEKEEILPAPVATNNAAKSDCQAIVADLESSFADINFCSSDADCTFAEGSCPFGCYLFHNKKLNFADYQPTLDEYKANCTPCAYKCASAPRQSNLRCREGRCVDVRYDS